MMASCSEGTLRQGEDLGFLGQRAEESKLPFPDGTTTTSAPSSTEALYRSFRDLVLPSNIYSVPIMLGV